MIYGYARVSTEDQDLETQIQELKQYGVEKIYSEKVSGTKFEDRKVLQKLIEDVQPGDKVIFTKLDRFARNLLEAKIILQTLKDNQVDVIIKDMNVDTSTAAGEFLFNIFASVAEFEINRLKERQKAGIALAKRRGVYKGRPARYTERHKGLQYAIKLFHERDENKMTVNEICEITKISRSTLYRALRKEDE